MGGLGPGIGGLEILVIGLLALIVVGPKDLPLLLRKVGRVVGKARAMANEFRSSFDEMARQSELEELRKEVQAMRSGQNMMPLGSEAEATFKDISAELNAPLTTEAAPPMLTGPEEWPDTAASEEAEPKVRAETKPKRKTAPTKRNSTSSSSATAKHRAPRKKAADQ